MAQPNIKSGSRRRDDFPIVFKNGSSETAPAYAIMQVDTVEGVPIDQARLVTIKKPDSTDGQYLVNGPIAVRAGKQGRCRMNGPLTLAYSGTAPALGDTVGPSSDSWLASTTGSGYDVLGGAEDGVVLCNRTGGGGSSAIRFARATTDITAATDNETPGSGDVEYMDDGDGSLTGNTDTVTNFLPWLFLEDSLVQVIAGTPPRVLNGTCGVFTWVAE